MNSTDIFAKLIAFKPTFPELKDYLGSIGIQANTKDGDPLVIFRYNREQANLTDPVVRAFRSVVWDSRLNRPVFVAPMKSESLDQLPTDYTNIIVEDFLDGVMVNVFMDPVTGNWRMATRSRLDADNKFYEHTFASLFSATWSSYFPNGFAMLNPQFGYSFVLQHPLNRIVVPVASPLISCVEICHINQAAVTVMFMPAVSPMMPPRRYSVASSEQLTDLMSHLEQFEGIRSQGAVIKDLTTGRRWKLRTQAYKSVRALRGNHSKMEYVWFDNMKKGSLPMYLSVYPEETVRAGEALKNWTAIVAEIYEWYVHVFKVRDCPKDKIPQHYKGVLFDLHGEYIKRLAPAKLSLTWNEHQVVMAKQDLKRIVFLSTFKPGSTPPPSAVKTAAAKKSNQKTWASVAAMATE